MVLVPRDSLGLFLGPPKRSNISHLQYAWKNVDSVIDYLTEYVGRFENPQHVLRALEYVSDKAAEANVSTTGLNLSKVLETMVQHGEFAIFERNAARHRGMLSLNFFDWARKWLDNVNQADDDKKWTDIERG